MDDQKIEEYLEKQVSNIFCTSWKGLLKFSGKLFL
jgi:hypothetical protein